MMKKTALLSLLVLPLLALPLVQLSAATGAVRDLSGSFEGWRQSGDANWRIENGEFVVDAGRGHLVTMDSFDDFRLTVEFWVGEGGNSGIYFRIADPERIVDTAAYEANIYDDRPDPAYRTGGVVHHASPLVQLNTVGQWNTYEITAQGDHIVVVLNGETTADFHDSTFASGPFSLQYGSSLMKFRNVRIESL